jgi:hypothetical protein
MPTFPITFPTSDIKSINIRARNVVGMSVSPFTGQQQVYKHQGQWWEMEVTMPAMKRADAEAVNAFLISLNGRYGTFLLGDVANPTPRGVATGTPLVYGAGQTGDTLVTSGWTSSTTGIMKAGDWIQLGSASATRLYKVLEDANSDGSGYATLSIYPNLRQSPSNGASVVITNPKGQWRLATNEHNYSIDIGKIYGITFACVEAL